MTEKLLLCWGCILSTVEEDLCGKGKEEEWGGSRGDGEGGGLKAQKDY